MGKKVNIGIIGFGNIGKAVAETLRKNQSIIQANSGLEIKVKKVCDVRRVKTSLPLTKNALDIINDPDISEVIRNGDGNWVNCIFSINRLRLATAGNFSGGTIGRTETGRCDCSAK